MLCLVLCLHIHNADNAFFEVAFKYCDLKKNQLIHTVTNSELFVYDWTNLFLIIILFVHMPIRPNSVLFSSNIANSSESFMNSVATNVHFFSSKMSFVIYIKSTYIEMNKKI